jgi:hypothetical protein
MANARGESGLVRTLSHVDPTAKERNPHADPHITVWEGPVFRRLAQVSAHPGTCRNFLAGFEGIRDQNYTLPELLLAHGVATITDYLHLKEHWFDDDKGWWPGRKVEEVMKDGLQAAFKAANTSGLPLQCYWIIYGPTGNSSRDDPKLPVFTRLADPPRPDHGTYLDAGYYSILFQFCTPWSSSWTGKP